MGAKQCELCDRAARIHCESDQASLCWECDAKVHGANFLVARHSRCLLCRSCQSPTPWRAEGARLGPTVSVCGRCSAAAASAEGSVGGAQDREEQEEGEGGGREEAEEEEGEEGGREEEDDDDEEDEDEADEEEDEEEEDGDNDFVDEDDDEGENQVVPWSLTPPPPVASSSSSEEEEEEEATESGRTGNGGGFLKRMRENADLPNSQEGLTCSSRSSYLASDPSLSPAARSTMAAAQAAEDEASSFASAFRPSRDCKRAALLRPTPTQPVADTAVAMLDVRVHHNNRRGVVLRTHLLSSSDPDRYKNIEG